MLSIGRCDLALLYVESVWVCVCVHPVKGMLQLWWQILISCANEFRSRFKFALFLDILDLKPLNNTFFFQEIAQQAVIATFVAIQLTNEVRLIGLMFKPKAWCSLV